MAYFINTNFKITQIFLSKSELIMKVSLCDTGLKRINKRNLNDGVYLIISKVSPKLALSIKSQYLINEPITYTTNQFFVIKYNDDEDYYTILALHPHQKIGVQEKSDSNYLNAKIIKIDDTHDKLMQCEISLIKFTVRKIL